MPVTNKQRIEVAPDLSFRSVRLERASHDWAQRADNAITTLSAQTVTVSEQVAMAKQIERAIGSLRDTELDMLALPEMSSDAAVHVPLVRGEDPLLHLHFLGGAAVVANDARHEEFAEAVAIISRPPEIRSIRSSIDCCVVRSLDFISSS
jgi:hypothetical protein